jgi:hypothetical protein
MKRYHQACLIWGPGNSTIKMRGMLVRRLGLSSEEKIEDKAVDVGAVGNTHFQLEKQAWQGCW